MVDYRGVKCSAIFNPFNCTYYADDIYGRISNEDFIYLIAGACSNKKSYHKLKIHYGHKYAYIKLHGYRCRLSDFIKV